MEVLGVGVREESYIVETVSSSATSKVQEVAYLVLKSPLIWALASVGCAFAFLPSSIAIGYVVVIVGGLLIYPQHVPKALLYEVALLDNIVREKLTQWNFIQSPYYNEILPGMYLGALPLKSHHQTLIHDLKIQAILSVVEGFELDTEVFFASPVNKKEWELYSIHVCHIEIPDMTMLGLDELHKGADFIKRYENHIYIHCKAGRGRSVAVTMAYLIKYKEMTYHEAYRFMEERRPIMYLTESQKKGLQAFAHSLNASFLDAVCTRGEL